MITIDLITYMVVTVAIIVVVLMGLLVIQIYRGNNKSDGGDSKTPHS